MRGVLGSASIACIAIACGRVGFDAADRVDAITPIDASADAPLPTGPFSAPTLVRPPSTAAEEQEPSCTADRLELFFRRGSDLMVATRTSTAMPFTEPTLIAELDSTPPNLTPWVTADGLTLYFSSARAGGVGAIDIWVTTRATRTSPWSAPANVTALNTPLDETNPWVTADGQTMYFASSRSSAQNDIYIATQTAASWSVPQRIGGLDDPNLNEGAPHLWGGDRYLIYYSSTGLDIDIWQGDRSPTGEFTNLRIVDELSEPGAIDWDPWISEDGRHILFGSNRSGNHEIYEASR